MKASQRKYVRSAMGLLGGIALLATHAVRADSDLEVCQGGYRILLMTSGECRAYLDEVRAAQARADYAAVLDLQEWHTELLIERSQTCPCRPNKVAGQSNRPEQTTPSQVANSVRQ